MLERLLDRIITRGDLTLIAPGGARRRVGDGTGPALAVRIASRRTLLRIARDPALAAGEAFMDGDLVMEQGTIADLLALVMQNLGTAALPGAARARAWLRRMTRRIAQFNPAARARANATHHYDIPLALYDLFLDPERQYSCAYFPRPGMSLEAAQAAKMRHIIAKLHLKPGVRVLDIGSGWGGLALALARAGVASVRGITLSPEQQRAAAARAEAEGLSGRVGFALEDYRATLGTFERIVSVGMFEHVGINHYGAFFRALAARLADDGVALVHTIGRSDGPGATNPFIAKYIFPGGYTPALSEMLPPIEAGGLIVADVEVLRLHYAETLRHWRERFLAARAAAAALMGERFCRMWEFYLAGAEMGFRHQGLVVFQLQLVKRIDALPLTRDYIAETEDRLAASLPAGPRKPAEAA